MDGSSVGCHVLMPWQLSALVGRMCFGSLKVVSLWQIIAKPTRRQYILFQTELFGRRWLDLKMKPMEVYGSRLTHQSRFGHLADQGKGEFAQKMLVVLNEWCIAAAAIRLDIFEQLVQLPYSSSILCKEDIHFSNLNFFFLFGFSLLICILFCVHRVKSEILGIWHSHYHCSVRQ